MEFKIWKPKRPYATLCLLLVLIAAACTKDEDGVQVKVKAPLRNYVITARLDNKQAGTDSPATGILKGTYSEKTKLFTYTLNYGNLSPTAISINKGTKGVVGAVIMKLMKSEGIAPNPPLAGEKHLSSLQERDLIKGLWFVTIGSAKYSLGEIAGMVTIKQK